MTKKFPERILVPLALGKTAEIDAVRTEGEDRVEMMRKAIDREIKRRERQKP